jgi:hypothetical protein
LVLPFVSRKRHLLELLEEDHQPQVLSSGGVAMPTETRAEADARFWAIVTQIENGEPGYTRQETQAA